MQVSPTGAARVCAVAWAFLMAGFVPLSHAATYESSIDISFPDEVAGLKFSGRDEFAQQDIGVFIGYEGAGVVLGSLYIYNAGLSTIPPGTAATVVTRHFDQLMDEAKQLKLGGKLRNVNLSEVGNQVTNYPACGPQFIWRAYEIELPEGALVSYTYLTAMKNRFVKLRINHPKSEAQGPRDTERFVQEIRKVLGGCK